MKKLRLFSILFSLIMFFSCFTFLVACSPKDLDSDDEGDSSSQEQEIEIADYVQGITVLYRPEVGTTDDMYYDGFNSVISGFTMNKTYFNDLADRQLSMLADDILFRLETVYGDGYESGYTAVRLTDKDNNDVKLFNTTTATYNYTDTVLKYSSGYNYADGSTADGTLVNLTDVASIAYQLNEGLGTLTFDSTSANVLLKNFQFSGAISGSKYNRTGTGFTTNDTSVAWKWSATTQYTDRTASYKNNLKMALAEVLATGVVDVNKVATDFTFDQAKYTANLNKLTHLGILSYDAEVIKNLIKYNIIGKDLIDADNASRDLLATKTTMENFTYTIEPASTDGYTTEQLAELDSMHNYKAYELVIDSMVNTLIANKFESSEVLIYPQMARLQTKNIPFSQMDRTEEDEDGNEQPAPYWTDTGLDIQSIILRPKRQMILSLVLAQIEQNTDPSLTSLYSRVNVNFVASGVKYTGSTSLEVAYGDMSTTKPLETPELGSPTGGSLSGNLDGPSIPEAPNNNDFQIDVEDMFLSQFTDGEIPWLYEYNGYDGEFTTINNPFTMVQNGSVSISTFYNAGNNYLEMTFEFFTDEGLTTPLTEMPDYSLSFLISDFSNVRETTEE